MRGRYWPRLQRVQTLNKRGEREGERERERETEKGKQPESSLQLSSSGARCFGAIPAHPLKRMHESIDNALAMGVAIEPQKR